MTVLKCKMCGGDLKFEEGVTVVDCEYCGTKQTVPTIDDEKKITLFSRANRLRFACEFDKASGIYESIVADFPEEAEAYWGLVLCKYGIEYVDDPATGKKIPTCHRSSFESVMEDENFEQVLENADPIARFIYREEAKQIEELRRGIIEVSNKEEPYDIFICYKETAENGERTIDSVIAQDVYHELTEKGYRVFFSRITLEDKLGQEYEPYIFAALNSAKIMLAFGTDYEYYNAVWVKNEWSRFLQLIAKGEKKTLIPCFKGIDAYDMPKEFARLQAQDMGKVGAMQDLLRGVEKLLPKKESEKAVQAQSGKETVIVQQPAQSATVDSLLKRAFMYLEDGDWGNAAEYCNHVLDINPENADAYVGLLMAELQVKKENELARQIKSFEQNKHFIKAVRFAGEERRKVLEGYNKAVMDYLTEQRQVLERRQEEEKRRQKEEKRRQELDQVLAQMSELLKEGKDLAKFKACAAFWANPDNKKENCLVDNREPRTIGDRYLYLAKHFQFDTGKVFGMSYCGPYFSEFTGKWWEFIFDCYRCALKYGANKEECTLSKQHFYELVRDVLSRTIEELEVLEKECPEDWEVYWKHYKLCSHHSSKIPTYEQEVHSFLAKNYQFKQSKHELENEQNLIQSLKAVVQEYSSFPQKWIETLQTYVEKAFTYAGDRLPDLQKDWEDDCLRMEEECAKEIEQLTERLNMVEKKIADESRWREELDKKYKRNAIMKGAICAAISMFLLMLTGYTVFYSWLINKKPEILLPYSSSGYTIVTVAACLIEMFVFPVIQNKLKQTEKTDYPYKKMASNLIKCSRPLTALAALVAAILFVSGASRFNASIGTICIGMPEEISYIQKHPGASFIITQDIDLSDTEWKAVSNFSGKLDGQGHCLKGIASRASYLFSNNTGTIENIVFAEIGISTDQFSLVRENRGTIETSQIQDIKLSECEFFGFSRKNKGTLQNCILTVVNGNSTNFAGVVQENDSNGIIENCTVSMIEISVSQSFSGIAMDNKGTIVDTVLSNCKVIGGNELAGICHDNSNMVRSCRVEELTAKDVILSLGGGLIANSSGSVEDCRVIGLELSGTMEGCFGGLIANSSGSVKDCSVLGLELSGAMEGCFGGLIANSSGSVEDCTVLGLELSGAMEGCFAGLIVNSSGSVEDCHVERLVVKDVILSLGGGLIANSSGSVKDCSVAGLELSGEVDGVIGGLIGQVNGDVTQCSVKDCSVAELKLSGEVDGVMGGLIGQSNGTVTQCSVEGSISLAGRSKISPQHAPWLICGGLVGEQLGGNVESSLSAVQISVDYYNPTYRGIFAGGLVGGIKGGCLISNSFFNGNIDVMVTEEEKLDGNQTSSDNYTATGSFYVGGLLGKYRIGKEAVTVENSFSSGKISVQVLKEVQSSSSWIHMGGFTGSDEARLSIRDSYSDLQIVSSVPLENRSALSNHIGNSIGGFTPDSGWGGATVVSAENCFFAGKLEYAQISAYHDCGMWGDSKVSNCYYSANCGYGKNGIPETSFCSASFLRDTLGWSSEVWNLEDGALPTLKNTGPMVKVESNEE